MAHPPQQQILKVNFIDVRLNGLKTEFDPLKGVTDEASALVEFDIPLSKDLPQFVIGWINKGLGSGGVNSIRSAVELSRPLHPNPLMGTIVIELPSLAIKALLLLTPILSSRSERAFLEGPMGSFMNPILLRLSRLDVFDTNPELHPPNTQARQSCSSRCAEG